MAILVPNKLVGKNEGYGRTINHFFSLFLEPHFKDKSKKFEKEKFDAAIIELFANGQAPKIRLGEEAEIEIEFKNKKLVPENEGKLISIDLKEIKSINWPSKGMDENSAKVLVVRFNQDWWILNFDFRYNQSNAKKTIHRAREFLSSCETVVRKKEYSPNVLIYLIWSTAELILDTKFLLHAEETRKKHYERENKLKSPIGASFFSSNFQNLLLALYKIKNDARYADEDYSNKYTVSDFRSYIKILQEEIRKY